MDKFSLSRLIQFSAIQAVKLADKVPAETKQA
jgi:hypothetical protein